MRSGGFLPRLLLVVPQLLGVVAIIFLMTHVIAGDPITALVGNYPAPPEYIAKLRHDLGLDQPLWAQFVDYLRELARGNLGYSFAYSAPVTAVIGARIGPTLLLAGSALVLGSLAGTVLGTYAATRHLRISDQALSILALLGFAVPAFWLSQILILVFAVHLGWLPALGMSALHSQPTAFGRLLDVARHLILPVAALSTGHVALMTRLVRSSMVETLQKDYIRTARAKGVSERLVVFRHAFRNALLPAITAAGYSVGLVLSTSALVETVFGWPGMGRLLYDSLFRRDYPTLTGIFLVTSVLAIAANMLADLAYGIADPRTRG